MTGGPELTRRRGRAAPAPLAVLAALLLLALPACSAQPPAPSARPTAAASGIGADASRTRAAELQAGLTHLLVVRVHATAAARAAVGDPGTSDALTSDALAALDDSAVALADLVGATYTGAREPLLGALTTVDRRAVEHAAAVRAGDGERALEDLRAAHASLGAVLRRVVPRLSAEQVGERLDGDLAALLAVEGTDPYAGLRAAARRAPDTAGLLSVGIAEDRGLGRAGTRAATLRAQLTGLLTEHVLLTGQVAVAPEALRPRAEAALRADGDELTGLLGTAYPQLAQEFGPAWSRHVDRVLALVARPDGPRRRAVLGFSGELGDLLARHVDGLAAMNVVVEADPLLAALVASVETGPSREVLSRATATVPVLSALLAAAIAEDQQYA